MKSYLGLIPLSAKVRRRQNRMTVLCILMAVLLVTAIFSMADIAIRMETAPGHRHPRPLARHAPIPAGGNRRCDHGGTGGESLCPVRRAELRPGGGLHHGRQALRGGGRRRSHPDRDLRRSGRGALPAVPGRNPSLPAGQGDASRWRWGTRSPSTPRRGSSSIPFRASAPM